MPARHHHLGHDTILRHANLVYCVATRSDPAPVSTASAPSPASTAELVFDARQLTKVYVMGEVEVHALRGVDFTIGDGEFLVLLGPLRQRQVDAC